MNELVRQRLVLKIRNGEQFGGYLNKLLRKENVDFNELEWYQDCEDLKMLICREMQNFYAQRMGVIYIAQLGDTNFFKVGKTTVAPEIREKALNNESTIETLTFKQTFQVFDCSTVEAEIHQTLKEKFPKKKEFFFGNEHELIKNVCEIISFTEGKILSPLIQIGLQLQR